MVDAAGRAHARPLAGVGAVMLVACAGSVASYAGGEAPRVRRGHPSGAVVHGAFEAVGARAERCLAPGDRVTVEGFFEGTRGEFFVERVGTASAATRARSNTASTAKPDGSRMRTRDPPPGSVEVSTGDAPGTWAASASSASREGTARPKPTKRGVGARATETT